MGSLSISDFSRASQLGVKALGHYHRLGLLEPAEVDELTGVVRRFRSIDPASITVMILGTLFIVRRQRLALSVTLTIGTGVRESAIFLIPLAYAVWAQRPLDTQALRGVPRPRLLTARGACATHRCQATPP